MQLVSLEPIFNDRGMGVSSGPGFSDVGIRVDSWVGVHGSSRALAAVLPNGVANGRQLSELIVTQCKCKRRLRMRSFALVRFVV